MNSSKLINIGVVGLSEGNGHPYSWSAIFNGYDAAAMTSCPFPVILDYLARQEFPRDQIANGRVTHIWTQDADISLHVSKASKIPNILSSLDEMAKRVDAVLLARDDAENHEEMGAPFLKSGLPTFIDKPLAYDTATARRLFAAEKYPGQLFSCSSLRYAKEFESLQNLRAAFRDKEVMISAVVPKNWDRYAVHVLEPLFYHLDIQKAPVEVRRMGNSYSVILDGGLSLEISVVSDGPSPICIKVAGKGNLEELIFKDTFYSFKKSLEEFIEYSCLKKERRIPMEQTLAIIQTIEMGRKA